mgnify:CR=1 FL=1
MQNQERYQESVHRLRLHGYEVISDGQGYIVRHVTDTTDVSQVRDLDDLIDFADLIDWRNQHSRLQLPP